MATNPKKPITTRPPRSPASILRASSRGLSKLKGRMGGARRKIRWYRPYQPKRVQLPRTIETRYGILYDPGFEGARSNDPRPGIPGGGGFAFHWTRENLQEMLFGKPPWGVDGHKVILHHRAQQPNGPLDELTKTRHGGRGFHGDNTYSVDRGEFAGQRARYWVNRARKHLEALLAGSPFLKESKVADDSSRLAGSRPPLPDGAARRNW